jgi:hypothetical protein
MKQSVKRAAVIGMILATLDEKDSNYLKENISKEAGERLAVAALEFFVTALSGEDNREEILNVIVELIEDLEE